MSQKHENPLLTDAQWQRMNYKLLRDLAENPDKARIIVDFLDAHPEIRSDLAGIYIRAQDTLRHSNP